MAYLEEQQLLQQQFESLLLLVPIATSCLLDAVSVNAVILAFPWLDNEGEREMTSIPDSTPISLKLVQGYS